MGSVSGAQDSRRHSQVVNPNSTYPGDVGLKIAHKGAESALCIAQKNPEMIGQKYEGEDLQARAVQFERPGEPLTDEEIDLIVRQQEQALLKASVGYQMDFVSKMHTTVDLLSPVFSYLSRTKRPKSFHLRLFSF